jgi:peptidoglycan endopeptidase LytF
MKKNDKPTPEQKAAAENVSSEKQERVPEEAKLQQVSCPAGALYAIQAGDTLFALAQRFNTTVNAIIAANPGIDPNNLRIGQVICIPLSTQLPPCPGNTLYIIGVGDTIFTIAQRFGTSVQAIITANPGIDPNNLIIGQVICIPEVVPTPPCPGGTLYTIRPGDTIFALAQRFGTTVQAIIAANPGIDPLRLQVGQVICIPAPAPPMCPGGTLYTIRPGDTIFALAQRFGTTVQAIIAANPGIDPLNLQIGQVICIPR